ncbi:hypothetical protein EOD41_14980 [Mucilaginibacter limnophilus]|uniref:Uncharacterized protein n=1 Tax=Mucilaginibacter limnophilus TaxID=1932778 RepID=A0A3S2V6Q3_9SPHI|nr:hypothetical protein [Mucilaginibacter limnophilus]RVT99746.1 hypothetical protein EOD41_14980 [Mucilaginibacter limnophilus]
MLSAIYKSFLSKTITIHLRFIAHMPLTHTKLRLIFLTLILLILSCGKTNELIQGLPINSDGDSLTSGSATSNYPRFLGRLLNVSIYNNGIGGQTAQQIAGRQGGLPLNITIENNKIDGGSKVNVIEITSEIAGETVPNWFLNSSSDAARMRGTVNGVACEIVRKGSQYIIRSLDKTSLVIQPRALFIPDDGRKQNNCIGIYWIGRNNINLKPSSDSTIYGVIEIAAKMVAYNKSGKYLVVGILNSIGEIKGTRGYNRAMLTNQKLEVIYGQHFVPMTPPTDEEMLAVNYRPTDEDRVYIANGVFPKGLRRDATHFNDTGNELIAKRIYKYFKANGYNK